MNNSGRDTTEVDFGAFGTQSQPTPALAPGASTQLTFTIPGLASGLALGDEAPVRLVEDRLHRPAGGSFSNSAS